MRKKVIIAWTEQEGIVRIDGDEEIELELRDYSYEEYEEYPLGENVKIDSDGNTYLESMM